MKYERLTKRNKDGSVLPIKTPKSDYIATVQEEWGELRQEMYDRLAELEDKIENGTLIEAKVCVWEEWEDDNLGSVWNCSNCKEDFCFMEGGVNENNYRYCPHCGAKIVALKELKG